MTHRPAAPKTRADSRLSIKDSESLDTYIQNTLSALYPPFEATAATVLWQLFHVVEKSYRGDGLRCLIDFLVPAKRILQCIQQDTCAKYAGLIFRHEGWPLCVHEKVVVQLASLHRVPLKFGDFYIQIVPQGSQAAKLVLKCLSRNGQAIEEVVVPECLYGNVFTMEFLENINLERNCCLHSCLLTSGTAVLRVNWKNIINPTFVSRPKNTPDNFHSGPVGHDQLIHISTSTEKMSEKLESGDPQEHCTSDDNIMPTAESETSEDKVDLRKVLPKVVQSLENDAGRESSEDSSEVTKGDHAVSPNNSNSTEGTLVASQVQSSDLPAESPTMKKDTLAVPVPEGRNVTKMVTFATDLSSPCPRRTPQRDSVNFETRRLFRKSYMEALQNPMQLGFSSKESITEESAEQKTEVSALTNESLRTCNTRTGDKQGRKCESASGKSQTKEGSENASSKQHCQAPIRSVTLPECFSATDNRAGRRRSKSLDMVYKNPQGKVQRTRISSGDSSNRNPKKLLNGYPVEGRKLDSAMHSSSAESRCSTADGNMSFISNRPEKRFSDTVVLPTNLGSSQSCAREMRRRGSCQAVLSLTPAATEMSSSVPRGEVVLQAQHIAQSCTDLPTTAAKVNSDLLQSGFAQLPGNRDKGGRAVIHVCTRNISWVNSNCNSAEVTHLLMYYCTIPRKEVRELGLTVLLDARRCQPALVLCKAFTALQVAIPNAINSVLVLVEKESAFRPERDTAVQYEILTSLKALHKHVDSSQLTQEFDGTFRHNHDDWIRFRMKLEPFMMGCREALIYLQTSINSLNASKIPGTEQEVVDLITKHKTMMKCVLEDTRLVGLRLEGGTVLARIRKEEFCDTEDYRDAIDSITLLYNRVDEEVHKLVILSNKSLQQLEILLELRQFEEGCSKIRQWAECEGEKHLIQLDCLPHSLESLRQAQEEFSVFYDLATQHYRKGTQLIKDAGHLNNCSPEEQVNFEEEVEQFKLFLSNLINRTEKRRLDLDNVVNLYEFYEMADKWVLHCNDYLGQLKMDEHSTPEYMEAAVQCLKSYHQEAAKFNAETLQKVNEMILNLASPRELKQWNIHWDKFQQTRHLLEEKLSVALRIQTGNHTSNSVTKTLSEDEGPRTSGEFDTEGSDELGDSFSQKIVGSVESNVWISDEIQHQEYSQSFLESGCTAVLNYEELNQTTTALHNFSTTSLSSTPACSRYQGGSPFLEDANDDWLVGASTASCHSEPVRSPSPRHKKQPLKKIMKKTQNFETSTREDSHGEAGRHGNTGVYIKGLEVVSNVVADKKRTLRPEVRSPVLTRTHSLPSSSRIYLPRTEEVKKTGSKLQHIMDEMIATEREYVKSLGYIIDHYFPEMERPDLPQDLRGKRNIIFGNLEKLYDFHCQYFLKELEHCANCPLRVSHCFRRHEEQFGMYALYSKNKPQSDTLLTSHGNAFFKNKQLALGDKMDLASYLLKPIQRMSKYALLLKDMIKECSKAQEQELADLQGAEEMVKFQLRHGNDLLAMDAIRGCDEEFILYFST
eukprot:gi/632945028/ref/XP_007887829.1/ PREDICTED: pleckstrin homology domain-containing family G member 4B [Callorhinchus milii]